MNTPYFRGSNEENAMATSPIAPPNTVNATPNRRVLGDVSTNPRVFSSPATGAMFSKRVMTGSPLKRTFTAAVEEGYGLKYLKKRRTSGDMFAPMEQRIQRTPRRVEDEGMARARSVPEVEVTHPEPVSEFPQSPTEPNTPSDSGGETHESFSSLINYDPSSQHATTSQSRQQQKRRKQQQQHQEPPPFEPQPQPQQLPHDQQYPQQQQHQSPSPDLIFPSVSHAETLRLRLQVAMYKIRTNQVNVPFAQLEVIEDERTKEMNQRRVSKAVEEAVATMRREAMERMPRHHEPAPKLVPGPPLYPTAYSSRTIQQPEPQASHASLGPLAAASLFMSNQQMQGSMESAGDGLLDLKNAY